MELLKSILITIPFIQIFLLLTISTLFLLFGRVRLALLANYVFTFYWGFGINFGRKDVFNIETLPWFGFSYLGFGLLIAILFLIGIYHTAQE